MSVRHLAAHLETLPIAFVAHDAQGKVILWNAAAEALLGWRAEEVLGQATPLPAELVDGSVQGSLTRVPRLWVQTRAGTELELAVASMPMPGGHGAGHVLWLPESEVAGLELATLRGVFEHLAAGAITVDRDGHVVASNRAFQQLVGGTAEEIVGRHVEAYFDLAGAPARSFGGLSALGERVRLRVRSGAKIPVHCKVLPLGGDRCVAFFEADKDEAPGDGERRLFDRVFASSGEAIVITNEKNAIIAVNEAFTRITGYALDEVLGKNPRLLSSGRQDRGFYEDMWASLQTTGSWRGELWNRRKSGAVYCEVSTISVVKNARGEVTNYVAVFADVTTARENEATMTYLAQRDHLTGLPNRTLVSDRLTQAIHSAQRQNRQVALLVVDLDGFKSINGTLGPAEGDALLKQVAKNLEGAVRAGDTVGRLGGDEFAVVLTSLEGLGVNHAIEQRLRAALAEPVRVGSQDLTLTASIGVAIFPRDGDSADALLSHADAAMYAAKDAGRNTTRFFDARMNDDASERLQLTQSLARALERGELHLHYQPKRPVTGDSLIGTEALLRWNHPSLGAVPPMRFIHLAEETGLIRPIGLWVLREAALRAKGWGVPVSVNLSVVQLADETFLAQVERVLAETGVPPALVELEVTESVVMKDPAAAIELLTRLKALGLGLSIDDFGTGYSSLAQLRRLPLDRLKIDRAFVRDLLTERAEQAVVEAIIAMGHALGLRVIAEGVETSEQRAILAQLGCDEIQGYWCGRPGAPELIDKELSRLVSA